MSRTIIPVNCAAIPHELAESLLFGYTRGAFTGAKNAQDGYFALAHGGTLFLDEVGDMPLALQPKLLRVLETGSYMPIGGTREQPIDVRVVAATNQELEARMSDGRFRSDLYFRLARAVVQILALRERVDDIPLLAQHFLSHLAKEMGFEQPTLSPEALIALQAYAFPGNVRELKNIIEYALIRSAGATIRAAHLRFLSPTPPTEPAPASQLPPSIPPISPAQSDSLRTDEDRILSYIRDHGSMTNAACRDLLKVDINRANYLLNKLYRSEVLTRVGSHRSARYELR